MCNYKVLVVIDYQKDFVDGKLPCGQDAKDIENYIFENVEKYIDKGYKVMFTMDRHGKKFKGSAEGKLFPEHCMENTPGVELYGKLNKFAYSANVERFYKTKYASFKLIENLKNVVEFNYVPIEVTFMGLATNVCVLQNALAAYNFVDADIIVDAKGCASWDRWKHKQALTYMKEIGITVINEDLVQ